jgi:hypothetical protein
MVAKLDNQANRPDDSTEFIGAGGSGDQIKQKWQRQNERTEAVKRHFVFDHVPSALIVFTVTQKLLPVA